MLQVLAAIAILYFVYVIARHVTGGSLSGSGGSLFGGRPKFKCETCKSCGKLFDDGVLCRFQGRETFKNETHIRNCVDYEKR